ncbi:hypothetical protein OQJ26_17145 [Legionella sp. PATHC038]|uniref:hypothetical protein n=1 Tax=Legionella sheltonii TaxID=2992041 RepID=UPI0022438964|nr:hypothetical protein [Legionella sp. PATHC038]MCW8400508.1 hypothetical protein [Legionella sp. PATHC038]
MNKVFGLIIGLVFCTIACASHNIFDELPQINSFDLVSEGDCPAFNPQKRCSDLDTVFYGCKEIPDSLEEVHQRTAFDFAQNAGGQ